jgi:small conductance mechanosensitive channel
MKFLNVFRLARMTIAVAFIFLAAASAFAQSGELIKPNPTTGARDSVDKVAKVPTAPDDTRTSEILNNLAKQSGWFPDVKIGVSGGVVSLEGHAKNAEQLEWLAKTADRLPTVIAVINKASVDQPAVTDLTPAWNEFKRLLNSAKRSLPQMLLAVVLIALFWFLSHFVYRGLGTLWGRHINNPFLHSTVTKISMVPVWLILFYLVLQTAGLSGLATTIIGGTGAVGIVLGFAFKDIAENYLSGILLAIRSPFTKGDDVSVAGNDGYVQALNMRGTTILSYDGTLVLVPNSIVIQSIIKNRTTNPRTRVAFDVGIGYSDSTGKAIDLITQAINDLPGVLKDPKPLVVVTSMGESAITITIRFWIDIRKSGRDLMRSAAIANTKEVLLANGISMPDGIQKINFTDALKIQQLGPEVDTSAVQNERLKGARKHADEILKQTQADQHETSNEHEDQIRKMADGVDIMDHSADKHLIKDVSL